VSTASGEAGPFGGGGGGGGGGGAALACWDIALNAATTDKATTTAITGRARTARIIPSPTAIAIPPITTNTDAPAPVAGNTQ
jgi:hypothetical protein